MIFRILLAVLLELALATSALAVDYKSAGGGSGSGTVTEVTADTQKFTVATGTSTPAIEPKGVYALPIPVTSTATINWNSGESQSATLTAATATTFTFSNPKNGGRYRLFLTQPAGGVGTVIWPGSVVWSNGAAQTVTPTASITTGFSFDYDGSSYQGASHASYSPAWNSLTDPTGNLVLSMASNVSSFTHGDVAGSGSLWKFKDGNGASGDGYIHDIETGTSSIRNPGRWCVNGTTNCISINSAGLLSSAGTAKIGYIAKTWLPAASCDNATATSNWDLPTSAPAVAACVTGTNTQKGVLDFANSVTLTAQITLALPSDWTATGGVDAKFKWLTTATAGSVVWQMSTICVADAETDDPAFNTASVVIDAAKGTTNQTNDATITGVTVTGCAAGELMHVKITRDHAHASDDLAATARLIGVELTLRRQY